MYNIIMTNEDRKERLKELIDQIDLYLLENKRVAMASKIDWGKIISISNQHIQEAILRADDKVEFAYTTDDIPEELEEKYGLDFSNNSPGYDIVMKFKNEDKVLRVQSKLRQVEGKTPFSRQVDMETTRRNSAKNVTKNQTGHVAYSSDEFDVVMVTLVLLPSKEKDETKKDLLKRQQAAREKFSNWYFSFIKVSELFDSNDQTKLKTKIDALTLESNLYEIK